MLKTVVIFILAFLLSSPAGAFTQGTEDEAALFAGYCLLMGLKVGELDRPAALRLAEKAGSHAKGAASYYQEDPQALVTGFVEAFEKNTLAGMRRKGKGGPEVDALVRDVVAAVQRAAR